MKRKAYVKYIVKKKPDCIVWIIIINPLLEFHFDHKIKRAMLLSAEHSMTKKL